MSDQHQPPSGGAAPEDTLKAVRRDFPHYRIWREITAGRTRYVARRAHPGTGPHTLVTDNLEDPADRDAAQNILIDFPEVAHAARANRLFVHRAVRYAAAHGITQYIDVGSGLPTSPAVHEAAQETEPAARVAYIDNDPLVLAYTRVLPATGRRVSVVPGDLRDPAAVLAHPDLQLLIDLDQPACLLLASVLHFLPRSEADIAVAAFRAALAPGSYLVISAGTCTGTNPALIDRLRSTYAGTSDITGHPAEDIAGWFTGFNLVPPGLVDVDAWRPGRPWHWLTPPTARILGGIARKPGRPTRR